jgi:hypothetical protein
VEISEEEETHSVEIEKPLEEEKEITTTQVEVSLTVRRTAAFRRFCFQLEETIEQETPIQEVEESSTVTLTVDRPSRDITLLKDNQQLKPSEHIKIVQISPTTTEIQIIKAKPEDEGKYSVIIDTKEQPLIQLKVIPKPVTRQTMDIPQTTFNEGETLTIKCEFDSAPEETFEFLRNEKPLIPDERISTTIEDNTYTIQVKNLKPEEDVGIYTLKSKHLILDTPSIIVVSKPKQPEKTETTEIIEVQEDTLLEEKKEQIVSACGMQLRMLIRSL